MRDLLMKQSIYERDILTQQSMKENPYSARDTKVKIDKRESLRVRKILTLLLMKENPNSSRFPNVTIDERES